MRTRWVLAVTTALLVPGAASLWNSPDGSKPRPLPGQSFDVAAASPTAAPPLPVTLRVAPTPAPPETPPSADVGAIAVPREAPPAAAGMVVAIDPESGELAMPTPEQFLELSPLEMNAASRSSEGLYEIALPNGGWAIDLQGRFQEFAIVETGPDGRLRHRCVDDHAAQSARRVAAPVLWEER